MIRLASTTTTRPRLAPAEQSCCSSAYDSASSSTNSDEELTVEKPIASAAPSLPQADKAPTIDNSLPIWEDYMPDIQKNIEDLTKALSSYLDKNKKSVRSPSSSSSSDSEDKKKTSELDKKAGVSSSPPPSVHQVSKKKKNSPTASVSKPSPVKKNQYRPGERHLCQKTRDNSCSWHIN